MKILLHATDSFSDNKIYNFITISYPNTEFAFIWMPIISLRLKYKICTLLKSSYFIVATNQLKASSSYILDSIYEYFHKIFSAIISSRQISDFIIFRLKIISVQIFKHIKLVHFIPHNNSPLVKMENSVGKQCSREVKLCTENSIRHLLSY